MIANNDASQQFSGLHRYSQTRYFIGNPDSSIELDLVNIKVQFTHCKFQFLKSYKRKILRIETGGATSSHSIPPFFGIFRTLFS